MHVTIVGAGVGGLTLALALARRGFSCTVLEQAQELGEVGAGLQLSPNAVKALRHLELEGEVIAASWLPEAIEVRDHWSRRVLLRSELGAGGAARWGAPYLQVHRADLHLVLQRATLASGRVGIELGRRAEICDGRLIVDGQERRPGNLLVGADGIRSRVRDWIAGVHAPRFTGQVAWRGVVPVARLQPNAPLAARVWTGERGHFVHYPVRCGELVNFVAVSKESDWKIESWFESGSVNALLAAFEGWPGEVRALIEAADPVMRWALYDRAPLSGWSKGDNTLLGDAAHPMAPFLAQGAAMAMEDAVILARCLGEGDSVGAALRRYEAARGARTAKVQGWSRRNARLFHLPSALAAGVFGLAETFDGVRGKSAQSRFDWLYGYDPTTAPI